MRILLTGGTGFIGSHLVPRLLEMGHQLTLLSRKNPSNQTEQAVIFCQDLAHLNNLNNFDAVINLAGEPIFDKRWTPSRKQKLTDSRVQLTAQLADLFAKSNQPPKVFISSSATGFYGDLPENINGGETTPTSGGFTAELCKKWEAEAFKAQPFTRLCIIRTGIVLSSHGGALKQMLPLYRYGLGGKLGDGKQIWAWIALEDYLNALIFLLENDQCSGIYNFVSPNAVSNATFNQWLAKSLGKPAFCHVPTFVLKCILGERASLLLDNQPLVSQRLLESGFSFKFNDINQLSAINKEC